MEIIFLHGFMGNKNDWNPITNKLKLEFNSQYSTYRIFTLDLPGHGKEPIYNNLSLDIYLSNLKKWEHDNNITHPIYIGYSMGGRIAAYRALNNQKTRGLILISSSFGISDQQDRKNREFKDSKLLEPVLNHSQSFENFLYNWYQLSIFRGLKDHPNFNLLIKKRLQNNPHKLQMALNTLGVAKWPYFMNKIKDCNIPTVYICGDDDQKYKKIGKQFQKNNHLVKLKILAQSSHYTPFEKPTMVINIIKDFIF